MSTRSQTQRHSRRQISKTRRMVCRLLRVHWEMVRACVRVHCARCTHRMLLECCVYRIKVRNIYCHAIWAVMCAMSSVRWVWVANECCGWRWWWWSVAWRNDGVIAWTRAKRQTCPYLFVLDADRPTDRFWIIIIFGSRNILLHRIHDRQRERNRDCFAMCADS